MSDSTIPLPASDRDERQIIFTLLACPSLAEDAKAAGVGAEHFTIPIMESAFRAFMAAADAGDKPGQTLGGVAEAVGAEGQFPAGTVAAELIGISDLVSGENIRALAERLAACWRDRREALIVEALSAGSIDHHEAAKRLSELAGMKGGRNPSEFDWSLVDASATWTGDSGTIDNLSDPPIIDGLLREREVVSVIGGAKSQKTWFSLALALHVAGGGPFCGFATHRRKVCYLDFESKERSLLKRLCMLSPERPDGFSYRCLRGSERLPSIADLGRMIQREGFGLVVVDSLYRTGWIREENSNDLVSQDLGALQRITQESACSIVVADHTGKGGPGDKSTVDAARGASAKAGFWDGMMVLRPYDKGPDPEGTYVLLDAVVRDWPRLKELPVVSFNWSQTSAWIEEVAGVDPAEAERTNLRVLEVVANSEKGVSVSDVAEATELSKSQADRALKSFLDKGKVVRQRDPGHPQRLLYRTPDLGDAT